MLATAARFRTATLNRFQPSRQAGPFGDRLLSISGPARTPRWSSRSTARAGAYSSLANSVYTPRHTLEASQQGALAFRFVLRAAPVPASCAAALPLRRARCWRPRNRTGWSGTAYWSPRRATGIGPQRRGLMNGAEPNLMPFGFGTRPDDLQDWPGLFLAIRAWIGHSWHNAIVSTVDDPTILSSCELWRRLNPDFCVPDESSKSGWRISSGAFDDSPDGSPMSIRVADKMAELGLGHDTVLTGEQLQEGWGLAAVTAGAVRNHGQIVYYSDEPGEPAHGSVEGKKPPKVRKRLSAASRPLINADCEKRSPNRRPPPIVAGF